MFSFINVIEGYLHEVLKSYDLIDTFITPSKFYREKLIEFGIPKDKVVHIANFIDTSKFEPKYEYGDYFVYIGRLSEEKGIHTLIRAMIDVKKSKLVIVGTGPLEIVLKEYVIKNNIRNIEFIGFKTGKELECIIQNSRFMVIPSEWYENGPMSMLECMAYGKAIIGANIGGIPEFIEEGVTGTTFTNRNYQELSTKINYFLDNTKDIVNMGKNARNKVENEFSSNNHYSNIIDLYNKLIVK